MVFGNRLIIFVLVLCLQKFFVSAGEHGWGWGNQIISEQEPGEGLTTWKYIPSVALGQVDTASRVGYVPSVGVGQAATKVIYVSSAETAQPQFTWGWGNNYLVGNDPKIVTWGYPSVRIDQGHTTWGLGSSPVVDNGYGLATWGYVPSVKIGQGQSTWRWGNSHLVENGNKLTTLEYVPAVKIGPGHTTTDWGNTVSVRTGW